MKRPVRFPVLLRALLVCAMLSPLAAIGQIDTLYDTVRVNVCHTRPYKGYGFRFTTVETSVLGRELMATRTFRGADGIDSALTIIATVTATPVATISGPSSVCQGGIAVLRVSSGTHWRWSNGSMADSTCVHTQGTYQVWCYTDEGCVDSATHTVTVERPIIHETTVDLCVGDSTLFEGEYKKEAGRYTAHWLKTAEGCDSMTALYIEVHPNPTVTISGDVSFCQGSEAKLVATGAKSYRWHDGVSGAVYQLHDEGVYRVEGRTEYGCLGRDSVEVHRFPVYTATTDTTICNGKSVAFYGRQLRAAGSYNYTDTTIHGCDSVVVVNLSVRPLTDTVIYVYATDRYVWHDSVYTEWGHYRHILTDQNGCDSSVLLYLGIVKGNAVPRILSYDDRLLLLDHYPGGPDSARVDYLAYRWARNGKYIDGAHTDQYRRAEYNELQGCYRIEVKVDSVHWVPSNVICFNDEYTFSGINSLYGTASGITTYPNPVKAGAPIRLFFEDESVSSAFNGVQLIDSKGLILFSGTMDTNNAVKAPERTGIYLLRLMNGREVIGTQKIIVK